MASTPHDFDFFMGGWRVSHRRLRERLAGCDQWEVFEGTTSTWAILGGAGNIDDNVIDTPAGAYRAATFRTFEPETGLWRIWWLDGRTPAVFDTPMVGEFEDGVGIFYADDTFAGRPIRVRFRWTGTANATPRWEQAFSPDGGETWEVNWTMDFTRAG